MRLRLLTIVGTTALALAVPSAALAHHGHGRHHHKAKAHHARFRFEHVSASGVSAPTSSPSSTVETLPPTPENAGEVTSYSTTSNVLVLTLNDKSTVSGKVSASTRIECVSATPPTSTEPGDDSGQGDDQSRGDMSEGDQSEGSQGEEKDGGDDDGEGAAAEPPCDSSLLEPGRKVRAAELRIGPSGTEFESIVLVR